MAIQVIDIYDCTTGTVKNLPAGKQAAGYTTGSGIAWTQGQWAAHTSPHPAVRIDQDAGARDPTADILDVEDRAATASQVVGWIKAARASFNAATRPGQRWPGIYCNMSTLDSILRPLAAAGITNVPFGIADLTNRNDAIAKVSSATGSYPRVWQQYAFGSNYDSGIVSVPWLTNVSKKVAPVANYQITTAPPGWAQSGSSVITIIIGTDGNPYVTITRDGKSWTIPVKLH